MSVSDRPEPKPVFLGPQSYTRLGDKLSIIFFEMRAGFPIDIPGYNLTTTLKGTQKPQDSWNVQA